MRFLKPVQVWLVLLSVAGSPAGGVEVSYSGCRNSAAGIRISGGFRIVSIRQPDEKILLANQAEPYLTESVLDYPQPPLGGFSSLIAITTSDHRRNLEFEWDHDLQTSYVGSSLNPPANENFVIGLFDTGSVVDLVAKPFDVTLGLTGQYLTQYTFPIGGVGGSVNATVSQPVGVFAAGLSAIDANGQLDLNQLVGHTNVSLLVSPEISCGTEQLTAVVGTPLISFFTTVLRNDNPQRVTVNDKTFTGPDIELLEQSDPCIPVYPRSISIEFGGLTQATTASYYGDIIDFITPEWPTFLSFGSPFIPFGGGVFFAEIGLLEGEPGPTNPLQSIRVALDTGAQTSIISPAVAANLSLPIEPDFTVDICGIGGILEDVPGYYVDYVKINALGGAIEFSQAPFIVLDLQSPEGGPLDGVLGTNFFWNRNIIFDPSLTASGFLHVSEQVCFGYVDFDGDRDVDMADFAIFASAWKTQYGDPGWNPACDVYIDNHIDTQDLAAFSQQWLRNY